jgi:hypothetical protein
VQETRVLVGLDVKGLATGLEVGEEFEASSPPPQTQHAWFAVAPLFSYMSPNFAQLLFTA